MNLYEIYDTYVIGYTNNTNQAFYIDIEDYESIKDMGWYERKDGYIECKLNQKHIRLHRHILNADKDKVVDHINQDKKDNRKQNLRAVTQQQNLFNRGVNKNNKINVKGVYLSKQGKYVAHIVINYKRIHLGTFSNIEDAIYARQQAELKYFGEYGYKGESD